MTLGAALLLLALGAGLWAVRAERNGVSVVVEKDIIASLSLEGQTVAPPTARADVKAPYPALVSKVYAYVGEMVGRGDVLVELAHPTAQAAFEKARAELRAAERAYEQARRQQQASLAALLRQLQAARAAESRARAASAVQLQPLEGGLTISVSAPDPALEAAVAARMSAEQALHQAQSQSGTTLAPYWQRLSAARQAFQKAQESRNAALIRAPLYGTLLELNAQPGAQIGERPEVPVATIVNLEELHVQAAMDLEEAGSVQPGKTVSLSFPDLPGKRFKVRIAGITTEPPRLLKRQRQVALVEFENEGGRVKPGMRARVTLTLGTAKGVPAVPNEALRNDEKGQTYIEVWRDGRWEKKTVVTGLSNRTHTAIRSGVKEGETVKLKNRLIPFS